MKKSFALFLALVLALGLIGVPAMYFGLTSEADHVEIMLMDERLDRSAAEGLTVKLRTQMGDHLFWDTVLLPEDPAASSTTHTIYPLGNRTPREYEEGPFYVSMPMLSGGVSTSGSINPEQEQGIFLPVADMMKDMKPGETKTQTFYLKDYYPILPLEYSVYDSNRLGRLEEGYSYSVYNGADKYFSIPTPEELTVTYTATMDAAGNVVEVGFEANAFLSIDCKSVRTDTGSYFTLSSIPEDITDEYGDKTLAVDLSHIKGGRGIYFVPYTTSEYGTDYYDFDAISMVYPLDPAITVCDIQCDPEGNLMLFTKEEQERWQLTVFEKDTMKTLAAVDLGEHEEGDRINYVIADGDYLVLWFSSDVLQVLRSSDYVLDRTCTVPQFLYREDAYDYPWANAVSVTEDRLAAITICGYAQGDYLLTVWEGEKPAYQATYRRSSALDRDLLNSGGYVDAADEAPLTISFAS